MIKLNEYINQQINEVFLTCLCGLFACWGIKTTFKTAEKIKDSSELLQGIWSLICDDFNNNDNNIIYEENQTKKINIKSNDIKPIQIPDKNILMKAIQATNPVQPTNDKEGKGLYTILDKLQKNKDFTNIDKPPYFPYYAAFVTKDKMVCGMFGFSIKFWKSMLKDDKLKKYAKQYKKYLHIFDLQICPEFDEKPIYDIAWDIFDKMIKETKSLGITIHADTKEEIEIYKKHGFEEIEGLKEYLVYQ